MKRIIKMKPIIVRLSYALSTIIAMLFYSVCVFACYLSPPITNPFAGENIIVGFLLAFLLSVERQVHIKCYASAYISSKRIIVSEYLLKAFVIISWGIIQIIWCLKIGKLILSPMIYTVIALAAEIWLLVLSIKIAEN